MDDLKEVILNEHAKVYCNLIACVCSMKHYKTSACNLVLKKYVALNLMPCIASFAQWSKFYAYIYTVYFQTD